MLWLVISQAYDYIETGISSPLRKRRDNLYKNAMSSIIINMVVAIF